MSGASLVTKGLVSGGDESSAVTPAASFPPGFGTSPSSPTLQHDAHVLVVIPTAINACLIAAENLTDNLRAQQPADIVLPSMYRRAYLVAYETDEIALVRQ